jgi:hypothetical protein
VSLVYDPCGRIWLNISENDNLDRLVSDRLDRLNSDRLYIVIG